MHAPSEEGLGRRHLAAIERAPGRNVEADLQVRVLGRADAAGHRAVGDVHRVDAAALAFQRELEHVRAVAEPRAARGIARDGLRHPAREELRGRDVVGRHESVGHGALS